MITTQMSRQQGELPVASAKQFAQNWYDASLQKLANSFYHVSLAKGELFKVLAFRLSLADTFLLINSPETEILNVYMTLVDNKWVPMLQGKKDDYQKNTFENCYLLQPLEEKVTLGKNNYASQIHFNLHLISPEFARIYTDKWRRITYSRLVGAFHNALKSKNGKTVERVRFYHFGNEVIKELKAMQPEHITLFLGCGDAASSQHPFSFRPVIKATRKQFSILFDFAQPCPPFCRGELTS